jgi:hypothetical protein
MVAITCFAYILAIMSTNILGNANKMQKLIFSMELKPHQAMNA